MQTYYSFHVLFYQLSSMIGGLDRYEMRNLSQAIQHDPNRVVTSLSSRQANYKVHTDLIPLLLRYLQRLQQTSWPLMFFFNPLTSVTQGYILTNVSLHAIPPIPVFQISVHLSDSKVNRVSKLMTLF